MYHKTEEVADIKKNIPVTGEGWSQGQHRGTDHGNTRSKEAGVYHTREDPRYRLCKNTPETLQCITAGCKVQAGMAYLELQN